MALFNPFAGLLVYICFAIIKPDSMWFWAVPKGNYSRIVAIALLVGWAMQGFGRWQFGKAKGIVAALVGLLAWATLDVMAAPDRELAMVYVESLSKIVLPFLVGITMIDSSRKLRTLAWVIMLSQGYAAYEFNLSYFEGINRLANSRFGGMDNNSNAIALVTGIGLAFFLGLGERNWWRKGLAFGCALMMAHAVMFSFSRGGLLALIIVGVVSFFLIPKQPKHYAIFAVAILLSLQLAGPQVRDRFMSSFADAEERDKSAQSRLALWRHCWDTMLRKPLTGGGTNNWGLIVTTYGWPKGKEAHSMWLQLGAELGFPGLLLLITFYATCIRRLWPLARGALAADPWFPEAARMVISSLAGFVVAAQFVSLDGLELPYYLVLLGAGVLKLQSQFEEGVALPA